MAGPWDTIGPPPQSAPDPYFLGNALSSLVGNYQAAQQGQQRAVSNDLRNKSDQMLLDQSKAFAGGVPMNPDGTPNYAAAMQKLAQLGDPTAVARFAPIIQEQQNIQGANAPDPVFGGSGGSSSGGSYKQPAAPAPGPWSSNDFLSTQVAAESEGNNSAVGDNGQAKGDFQFHDATWQRYAKNVPGASQYASAADAPPEVQQAVAETAPISEWGPRTKAILHAKFGNFDDSQTVGQLAQEFGGGKGGGTQVASLGASDATAYASPDKPSIPPVSAAAGSSIPRENATTATQAVGGAPAAPASPLDASNPAWGGVNAALPVGPPGAPQQAPAAPTPRAAAPAPGSVASIASQAGIPPQVAANIARAVGAPPDAPLNPQQQQRAQTIIQNYKQRAQQQQQQTAPQGQGQGQPQQGGGPVVPQFPFPPGAKDPQQAIMMIDQDIARLGRFGPAANGRIRALEDMRDRIAQSAAPLKVTPYERLVDPRTGQDLIKPNSVGALTGAAIDQAAETYYQTGKPPPNIGRGTQGAANIAAIINRAAQLHPDDPIEGWAERQQAFNAGASGQRMLANRTATLSLAENEAKSLIPRVLDASKAVSRTQYPSLNRIIEAGQTGTGDPNVIRLGIAAESLAQTYARVLSPTGTPTVADKENAHSILDKAWSQGQIEAAMDQMEKEIDSAKKSLNTTRKEMGAPGLNNDDAAAPRGGASAGGALPPGWTVEVH